MLKRAYSVLEIKSADEEKRELTGIASTPAPDRMGDVVEPKGAEFELPLPFLWQHDARQPIGHVMRAKVSATEIEVGISIVKTEEPGRLKDRLDEAWQSIKLGLVRGLSIGFKEIEYAFIGDSYGIHFTKWLWLELSAVTIPANGDASIIGIKSIARAEQAASGLITRSPVILIPPRPGVSGVEKAAKRGAVSLITRG
jgi:HK97 family phage prohead protease